MANTPIHFWRTPSFDVSTQTVERSESKTSAWAFKVDEHTVGEAVKNLALIRIVERREANRDQPYSRAGLTTEGRKYVEATIESSYGDTPRWGGLTVPETATIFQSVAPSVTFGYSKAFQITQKNIEPIRAQMKEQVRDLREGNSEYFRKLLGLPEGTRVPLYFVQVDDPTRRAGLEDSYKVVIRRGYPSLEAALEDGARITAMMVLVDEDEGTLEWLTYIEADREEKRYKAGVNEELGSGSDLWRKPLAYQKSLPRKGSAVARQHLRPRAGEEDRSGVSRIIRRT